MTTKMMQFTSGNRLRCLTRCAIWGDKPVVLLQYLRHNHLTDQRGRNTEAVPDADAHMLQFFDYFLNDEPTLACQRGIKRDDRYTF